MILGIGTDLVQRDRVKAIYEKYDKRFLDKVLSDFEKKEFIKLKENAKVNFLCSSFAAKEAFVKAIGTGFRADINFIDIEIKNYKNGKPYISLSKKLNNFLQKKFKIQKYKVFLSLSDEKDYSIAFVVIDKKI